jgi:hypothetical protein
MLTQANGYHYPYYGFFSHETSGYAVDLLPSMKELII